MALFFLNQGFLDQIKDICQKSVELFEEVDTECEVREQKKFIFIPSCPKIIVAPNESIHKSSKVSVGVVYYQ